MSDSTIYINPKNQPEAAIIWLHGLGANAQDLAGIPADLHLPQKTNIRHIFPNAPMRAVALAEGMTINAWFDLVDLSFDSIKDEIGIRQANETIEQLIEDEIHHGIPSNKIILAGFSQGGAMALHAGLRYKKPLAGIIALSSFLVLQNKLPSEKSKENEQIPILMLHGTYDPLIPLKFSEHFYSYLTSLGYQVKLNVYNMAHEICPKEIADISTWITQLLS